MLGHRLECDREHLKVGFFFELLDGGAGIVGVATGRKSHCGVARALGLLDFAFKVRAIERNY
jgi:hypothetical protein